MPVRSTMPAMPGATPMARRPNGIRASLTLRAGVFDLSATPAGGALNAAAYGLDNTFSQQQYVGEIEERHQLWGQPGKLKITAFLSHGRAGDFAGAVALSQPGQPFAGDPSTALASLRSYRDRTGVSLNLEQQLTETMGMFARAGWADGNIEPWDFTDVDRTVSGGVSINGKNWGRPDDTIGVAGIINGLAPNHQAYFDRGRLGHPDRRRCAAELRARTDRRGLLQLCHHGLDESHVRLSVHS